MNTDRIIIPNKQVELLSPAGTFETFLSVVNAGADAVYAAGTSFGARAYAGNFSTEELIEAIRIAHLKGRRFYLTINTLLKNTEISRELYDYFAPIYEAGIDGVIIQDYGVISFLKREFPDTELHASTQMTVASADGVKMLADYGFSQVVLPRELSLEEIAEIHRTTEVRLEVFTHGALCYCYSGQCLMSSVLGGRSGNRGKCAQPCRLSYDVCQNTGGKTIKSGYPLSLKDNASLDLLPDLVKAGVSSLKIEGRMKSPEYASGVTALYRKYLDLALEGKNASVSREDAKALLDLGNRSGHTKGYLTGIGEKHSQMITWEKPSFEKKEDNSILQSIWKEDLGSLHKIECQLRADAKIGQPFTLTLEALGHSVTVTTDTVSAAQNRPVTPEEIREKLSKLGNTPFVASDILINADENIFLGMKAINEARRLAVEAFYDLLPKRSLTIERNKSIDSLNDGCHEIENGDFLEKATEEANSKYENKELRVSASCMTMEQYKVLAASSTVRRIYLDCHGFTDEELIAILEKRKADQEIYLSLPMIFRKKQWAAYEEKIDFLKNFDGFLLRSIDEIAFTRKYFSEKHVIADANLYTTNNEAIDFLSAFGITETTIPLELNAKEIAHRRNETSEMVIYGRYPLMVSAQCIYRNTYGDCIRSEKDSHILSLKDRYKKEFPVRMLCDSCCNCIYNAIPTCLFTQMDRIRALQPAGIRLSFTMENAKECREVLGAFEKETYLEEETTNGHFKRGVE